MSFRDKLEEIEIIHQKTKQRIEKTKKPYEARVKQLEMEVSKAFREILDEIGPVCSEWYLPHNKTGEGATVLDFECRYLEADGNFQKIPGFEIKINKIKTPEGIIPVENRNACPHIWLEQITGFGNYKQDPRIKQFMDEYEVRHIDDPENYCEHK